MKKISKRTTLKFLNKIVYLRYKYTSDKTYEIVCFVDNIDDNHVYYSNDRLIGKPGVGFHGCALIRKIEQISELTLNVK